MLRPLCPHSPQEVGARGSLAGPNNHPQRKGKWSHCWTPKVKQVLGSVAINHFDQPFPKNTSIYYIYTFLSGFPNHLTRKLFHCLFSRNVFFNGSSWSPGNLHFSWTFRDGHGTWLWQQTPHLATQIRNFTTCNHTISAFFNGENVFVCQKNIDI